MPLGGSNVSADALDAAIRSFGIATQAGAPVFPAHQSYPPGAELFRQGDAAREVFHLGQGLVKLRRTQPDGVEAIVGLRSGGWSLGAAAAVLGKTYATTAVTASRCSVSRLCIRQFVRLVRTDHEFSWQLHQMHSREVYEELAQIADLGCLSARHRLEHFFEQLLPALGATGCNGEIRVELPLKQWEIAQLIAVTPQHLCRLLHDMEGEGMVRREREAIVIVAAAGLRGRVAWKSSENC